MRIQEGGPLRIHQVHKLPAPYSDFFFQALGAHPGLDFQVRDVFARQERLHALWAWPGEKQLAGRASLYRGPILLAYDPRFDALNPDELPVLDLSGEPNLVETPKDTRPKPILLVGLPAQGGGSLTLCDFASAGAAWADDPATRPRTGESAIYSNGAVYSFQRLTRTNGRHQLL